MGSNVAARLEAMADPGGICVSRVVRDQVRDRLDYTFADLGDQQVKHIARPIRVYALHRENNAQLPTSAVVPIRDMLISAGRGRSILPLVATAVGALLVIAVAAWWLWLAPRTTTTSATVSAAATTPIAPRLSIVVLPFANLSNDPDQQYFADGITEDLPTDLSHIPDMIVIAAPRSPSKTSRLTQNKSAATWGYGICSKAVSSVPATKFGSTHNWLKTETAAHLWAERFDRNMDDLLVLQNEITNRIANTLGVELINR
jgi:adenylate cyclase